MHACRVTESQKEWDEGLSSLQSNGEPGRHQRDPKSQGMPLYQEAW